MSDGSFAWVRLLRASAHIIRRTGSLSEGSQQSPLT